MTNARHLVAGGCGYFGSVMVEALRRRGISVRVFDLEDSPDRPTDVEFVQGDVRDVSAVKRAVDGIDVVYHNIAVVPLSKDFELFRSVNYEGTRLLTEAARDAGVAHFVYTSSSAIYGIPQNNPVTLQTPPSPGEAYGEAKLAGERICREVAGDQMLTSIIRPRTIVGAGRLGIMQILFEWIREGTNVPVLGGGDNRYQFVHGDDLADACILAAARDEPGEYNIGAEEFGTMRETIEAVIAHAGSTSTIRSLPRWPLEIAMNVTSRVGLSPLGAYHSLMYGREMWFDVSEATEALGWRSRYSNIDMFCEAYDWYVNNRREILARRGGSTHRRPVRQGILSLARWVL